MPTRNQQHRTECPFELAMDLVSGKWKGMIIFKLIQKPLRYSDLKTSLNNISGRMLSLSLKQLEKDKLIELTPENCYRLTSIGKELILAYNALNDWGKNYQTYLKK